MGFSYYNPNERYRRRAAARFGNFVTMSLLVLLIFGAGFWFGKQNAGQQEKVLKGRVKTMAEEARQMEQDLIEMRSTAQTATARYEQLQATYDEQLPEGPVRELLELVRKQLDEGRDPERLSFLIRSARPPRNCSDIETRRFVVSTPTNNAPASKISVADGAITVTGNGLSARNEKGQPEAWFDSARAVGVDFKSLGGEMESKKGVFPIHHSMVVGAREYRFTITDGARSFAKVTYDSCDYP
ncbi:MAG: hypothetical protein AB8B83_02490 [Bdellovibrionales bacterium]